MIYFDYAATTPVDPRVADKMMQHLTLTGVFANPASRSHRLGWEAEAAVEDARLQVADLIQADSREIVWTSGATEANNLAIKGVVANSQSLNKAHIISSTIEHKAVLDVLTELEKQGVSVTLLSPTPASGVVTAEQVSAALQPNTVLVSLMMVNNEIGCINDIKAIADTIAIHNQTHECNTLFHVDAAQAVGKVAIDVKTLGIDLMSFSAHKVYAAKGIGALYVRRHPSVKVQAQIHGGGHERGMRSGTLPTHQIVSMGEAFELVQQEFQQDKHHIQQLHDSFLQAMHQLAQTSGVVIEINGDKTNKVPNIINLRFEGLENESLMMAMPTIAISSGSACNSKTVASSYVLRGIGLTDAQAHSSLRFSFGRFTTSDDVAQLIEQLTQAVNQLVSLKKP